MNIVSVWKKMLGIVRGRQVKAEVKRVLTREIQEPVEVEPVVGKVRRVVTPGAFGRPRVAVGGAVLCWKAVKVPVFRA